MLYYSILYYVIGRLNERRRAERQGQKRDTTQGNGRPREAPRGHGRPRLEVTEASSCAHILAGTQNLVL